MQTVLLHGSNPFSLKTTGVPSRSDSAGVGQALYQCTKWGIRSVPILELDHDRQIRRSDPNQIDHAPPRIFHRFSKRHLIGLNAITHPCEERAIGSSRSRVPSLPNPLLQKTLPSEIAGMRRTVKCICLPRCRIPTWGGFTSAI